LSARIHLCPICGKPHQPSRARVEMAQGAALCCGPACEDEKRARARADALRVWQARSEAAAFLAVFLLLGIVLFVKWA
jgi:hypothetical protein